MKKLGSTFINGLFRENPTLVLMIGMCPTLAVTTSAINGIGMGLSTTVVLVLSNLIIGALHNIIPEKVRIPAYIVVIASFVTIVDLLLQAYIPSLYSALGIYIPLIVVNCIIFGRAESFASKNGPIVSAFDGLGMGLGFTLAITIIGFIREVLGAGTMFDVPVLANAGFVPVSIFIMAPGALLVLAFVTAIQNRMLWPSATNTPEGEARMDTGENLAHEMTADEIENNPVRKKIEENTGVARAAAAARDAEEKAGNAAADAAGAAKEASGDVKDTAKEASGDVKDTAKEASNAVKQASDAAEDAAAKKGGND